MGGAFPSSASLIDGLVPGHGPRNTMGYREAFPAAQLLDLVGLDPNGYGRVGDAARRAEIAKRLGTSVMLPKGMAIDDGGDPGRPASSDDGPWTRSCTCSAPGGLAWDLSSPGSVWSAKGWIAVAPAAAAHRPEVRRGLQYPYLATTRRLAPGPTLRGAYRRPKRR